MSHYLIFLMFSLFRFSEDPVSHVRLFHEVTVHEKEGQIQVQTELRASYVLTTEQAIKEAYFPVAENFFNQVSRIRAEINGKSVKQNFQESIRPDLDDVFLSDLKIHWLDFRDLVKVGDTLTYSYQIDHQSAIFSPILSVPNLNQIDQFDVVINHPESVQVDFKWAFPDLEITPTLNRENPKQTRLTVTQIPHHPPYKYYAFNGQVGFIFPILTQAGQAIDGHTPASFGTWYEKHIQDLENLTLDQRAQVQDLVKEKATPHEQLKALYDYVCENIRYVADETHLNALIPRSPAQTLSRGFGDCKDRALLLSAMAAELGLDVKMVLVSTDIEVEPDLVHPALFNHVINAVQENGEWLFFDATNRYFPFGCLIGELTNQRALILAGPNTAYTRIPARAQLPDLKIQITAQTGQEKEALATVVLANDLAAAVRKVLKENSQLEHENFVSNLLNSLIGNISLDYFLVENQAADQVSYRAQADLSGFLVQTSKKIYVPSTPFLTSDQELSIRSSDSYALNLPDGLWLEMSIQLVHPGFQSATQNWQLGQEGLGFFRADAVANPEGTQLNYRFQHPLKRILSEEKAAYLTFNSAYLANRKNMFLFQRSE
ncbi:MAG: hypothetical protein H6510_00685 [Acidobacteria bacterium]|nr:hypothetical protein [Acidobacteriota bacterium]MCB9396305.1 hypothetical protein [Acidobacteriota bacterium]